MSKPKPGTFAARLIYARGEWTQGRLERIARLTSGSVWQYEQEGRQPNLRSLQALADALGCSVGWLAAGDGAAPTPRTLDEEPRP